MHQNYYMVASLSYLRDLSFGRFDKFVLIQFLKFIEVFMDAFFFDIDILKQNRVFLGAGEQVFFDNIHRVGSLHIVFVSQRLCLCYFKHCEELQFINGTYPFWELYFRKGPLRYSCRP